MPTTTTSVGAARATHAAARETDVPTTGEEPLMRLVPRFVRRWWLRHVVHPLDLVYDRLDEHRREADRDHGQR